MDRANPYTAPSKLSRTNIVSKLGQVIGHMKLNREESYGGITLTNLSTTGGQIRLARRMGLVYAGSKPMFRC